MQQDHISGNQFLGRNHARLPFTQGHGFGRKHVANRIQGFLGLSFLNKAKQGVDNDHAQDHRGIQPFAEEDFAECCAEQYIDEDVVDLREEAHERPRLAPVGRRLGPYFWSRSETSLESRPDSGLVASFSTTSFGAMACHAVTCGLAV